MTEDLIGKIIGGYEILDKIGQGGMATVFLARQQSMNRNVALKVLPRQYINDNTYMQRFEQEVKIVSTLEHRNIVPVYDYGDYEGQPYLTMRYMPAGSIDELLKKGPLPPEQVLDIITQIAPALDYAHKKSILHRDLKPSNVLMDDGGGAYITDFGIARVLGDQGAGITTQGVVGTPSYMSPEQAQALPMDGRSDIYALGVMLFEMLTGRRPFESDTPYSIAVMQVTKAPPAASAYNASLSTAVEHVIFKVLNKKPEDRYGTAVELAEALDEAIKNPRQHDTQPKSDHLGREVLREAHEHQQQQSIQQYVPPPQSAQPQMQFIQPARVQQPSPAPMQPVYDTQNRPPRRRFRKKGASPWVSVVVGGLIGCALLTGVALIGALVVSMLSPSDSPTATLDSGAVVRTPQDTVTPAPDEAATLGALPDNMPTLDETSIAARQTLVARSTAIDPTLTAQAQQLDATFTEVAAATAVGPTRTPGIQPVGIREGTPELASALRPSSGELLYFDERDSTFNDEVFRSTEIVRVNLDSWIETQLTDDLATNSYPLASPDGRWIVFQSDRDGDFEIYIMNLVGSQLRQLTFNDYTDRLPAWSPDGEWIIYSADVREDGTYDLYRVRADGSDNEEVFSNGWRNSHARYSPDGQYIVFTSGPDIRDARTWEIVRLAVESGDFVQLTNNDFRDSSPLYSPDGSTILYSTYNDGDMDLAVMNPDGGNRRILYIHPGNDWTANYSLDGQFIAFWSVVDNQDQLFLMTADASSIQQITTGGGAYPSFIPPISD